MHHVLHILGTARSEGASIARIVGLFGELADSARFKMHAWFLDGDGPLRSEIEAQGVSTRSVPWNRGTRDIRGMFAFWQALREQRFSIIHQHQGGGSARVAAQFAGRPKILRHVWGLVDESSGVAAPQGSVTFRTCDRVVACSKAVASQIRGGEAMVVYAGIKPRHRTPRREHDGGVVIGAASRMVPSKGFPVLLDAAQMLLSAGVRARIEIAGDGPDAAALQDRVRRDNLVNVKFLGWTDVDTVLPSWDIFVQPSLHEPFGLANVEAMSEGLPVVASRSGGIPEVVVDGVTGLLAEPGNASQLAESLKRLVTDADLRRAMGEAGRARADEVFRAERMVQGFTRVYEQMLA